MNSGNDILDDRAIENHLVKALYELALIREEYIYRRDMRKSVIIKRSMDNLFKEFPKLKKRWKFEEEKWKL